MATASSSTSAAPASCCTRCWRRSTSGTSTRCRSSRGATPPPSSSRETIFDRVAGRLAAGDLGAGAAGHREDAGHAGRIARRVGGLRGPAPTTVAAGMTGEPGGTTSRRFVSFVVPGPLDTPTGGYAYDRATDRGSSPPAAGRSTCTSSTAPFRCPTPRRSRRPTRCWPRWPTTRWSSATAWPSARCPRPRGVTPRGCGWWPWSIIRSRPKPGSPREAAAALFDSERRALAATRGVVVTSRATAAMLAAYGVADERITVVVPGTSRAPAARGTRAGDRAGRRAAAVRGDAGTAQGARGAARGARPGPRPPLAAHLRGQPGARFGHGGTRPRSRRGPAASPRR